MFGRRSRRQRRGERGATLFVVVLAITLLTGVGLYTVHSSSLSARAASSGRQALQAERITELHGVATLSYLRRSVAPNLEEYFRPDDPSRPRDICEMNRGLPGTPFCRKIPLPNIAPASGAPLLATDSLGPLGALSGGALIELTDVYGPPVPIPGSDNKFGYYQGTVTVVGRLDPAGMAGTCVANQMQVAAQHIVRARIMMGPVQLN